VQVLTQAREPLIRRTFESLRGAKRAKRMPLIVMGVALAAIGVTSTLYIAIGRWAVSGELGQRGYTDLDVHRTRPFTYAFSGKKGETTRCFGSFTRMPFSTSMNEICSNITVAAPTPPPPPMRERLERSLREHYTQTGFERFQCHDVGPSDTTVACTMSASNGTSMPVSIEQTKAGEGGHWEAWTMNLPAPALNADVWGPRLSKEVTDTLHAKGRKLAVDIEQEVTAGGGALHADCEAVLLEAGSRQLDIWGADWVPLSQEVLYEALINIRPSQSNPSMTILDSEIRARVKKVVESLLGEV